MQLFTSTEPIAREGWKIIGIVLVFLLISIVVNFGQILMVLILFLTLYIYRNPERIAYEDDPLAIISPCDGKIIKIDKIQNKFIGDKQFLHVVIKNLPFATGVIRFPFKGKFVDAKTIYGLFLPSSDRLSKTLNERVEIFCMHENGEFILELRAGFFSRNIYITNQRGNLKSGKRIAFMVDGIVEMFLPIDSRIKFGVGDYVKSGESVLGYLNYKENEMSKIK